MADGYKVGNLEIAFEAVDKTSASFKDLAKNLNTIYKVIDKIANADLSPFVANMQKVRKAFSPLLKNISGAGEGIIALNQAIQKVGVSRLSKVSQEFINIRKTVEDITSTVVETNAKISEGSQDLHKTEVAYNGIAKSQSQVEIIAKRLTAALSTHTYDRISSSVSGLASQWKNLYATMQKSGIYDRLTGGLFSNAASEKLENLTQDYLAQKAAMDKVNDAFKQVEETYRRSRLSAEELTIEEYQQVEASRKQRIEFLEAALALGKAGENTKAYRQELKKLQEEQNKSGKSASKAAGGFKKFLKSLGRIALYRTIRRALQLITQSITETIQEFAKLDDNVNNTMSSVTSSLKVIQLSFGSLFLPLLEMVAPLLQEIAQAFANFANTISQATAKSDTYWAINAEAIQDYREQLEKTTGLLASFDKFNTLNAKNDSSIFFEEREVDKENKSVKDMGETIESIKNIISSLWDIIKIGWENIVKPIWDNVKDFIPDILTGISNITNGVGLFITKLNELGLLKPLIIIIATALGALYAQKVITGITNLISKLGTLHLGLLAVFAAVGLAYQVMESWGNMSTWQRVIAVIGTATVAILGLAIALGAFQSAWSLGVAVAGIVAGIAAVTTAIAAAKKEATGSSDVSSISVDLFANGGMPDKGTMFIAGEAGAEAVYNTPSGQTGVANINQLKSAFYQALVEWGNTSGKDINVNISLNGMEVAKLIEKYGVTH